MGYFQPTDVLQAIGALEMLLKEVGYPVEMGKGVKVAEEILSS